MSSINKYRVYCETEATYTYGWYESEPSVCPNNNAHIITSTLTTIVETVDSVGNFDSSGKLNVNVGGKTQFGELRVSKFNPIFQNYALYNIINSQMYKLLTGNGGTITPSINGTEIDINISTTVGSYSVLRSTKVCKYRPGYNLVLRWNNSYTTPVANLFQFAGLGNNGSDIYFCYNGTDFGVRYSTGGYSEVRLLTITEQNSNVNATVVLNGVSYTVPLTKSNSNPNFTAYQIGSFSYPGWITSTSENRIAFVSENVGAKNGVYSYTAVGNTGTFSQLKAGSPLTTTFINRTNWNGTSRMIQDLDPLKRNMYSINYTWYGSGNMTFKVFDPESSSYETVHTIKFANLTTQPSLTQPNMYLQQGIASLGSTVAKTITVAGGFAAVEGKFNIEYPIYSIDNTTIISKDTPTVLCSIKNRNSINGLVINSDILLRKISINVDGNKPVKVQIIKNANLNITSNTVFPDWVFVNQHESITAYDTTTRSYTGGNILSTYYFGKSDTILIDLTDKEIIIFKSDILTFVATSKSESEISIALTFVEDY